MDNLVLIRVAAALDRAFSRSVLREVREEHGHRYRLLFERADRRHSFQVSLRAELPWIGCPPERGARTRGRRGPFGAALGRALGGAVLESVRKAPSDRLVHMRFVGGRTLVAELATHGANLILLDDESRVVAAARRPPSARKRIVPGQPYRPPTLPRGLCDPAATTAGVLTELVRRRAAEGESPFELLRRGVFGVGSEGARLMVDEWSSAGGPIGELVLARLEALRRGELDPVVLAPTDPVQLVRCGKLDPGSVRLLPWEPADPPSGLRPFRGSDPAGTAGLYHEIVESRLLREERAAALQRILDREIERLDSAARRAKSDLATFREPERYRRFGEALLAGIARSRRQGEVVLVPDPYDAEQREMAIPVKPGRSVQEAANDYFRRYRRATRGIERARQRGGSLARRREELRSLRERHADAAGDARIDELEQAMRAAGVPVGLEPGTRAGRAAARGRRPRLEGVRMLTSSDGLAILVGRSAAHNQRLTFQLAGPEDFWFHAQGQAGAHVVVRNEPRRSRPPEATLREAAAAAAWFSGVKSQSWADVMWTRKKYVRRPRGAPPGTVTVKRFETTRVRPGLPPGCADEGCG